MLVETPNGTSVHIRRDFTASVERVYQAFTEPERMATWMWGSLGSNVSAEADVRVGGRYVLYTDAPAGNQDAWYRDRWGMTGTYALVEPRQRLVYTIHWDGPVGYNDGNVNVEDEVAVVEFSEADGAATVDFHHLGIPDDGHSAATHAEGIAETFDVLAEMVEPADS